MIEFNPNDIVQLQRLVAQANRIVVTCHVAPDGDAIGSTLALCRVLNAMGKNAAVVTPDSPPRTLAFLPGASRIIVASRQSEKAMVHIAQADLIMCLDFNALMRVDRLEQQLRDAKAPKVLIDHHLSPEDFPVLAFSYPHSSSTCYLLYNLVKAAGWGGLIDYDVAECIFTGMMTDTGNFSYNSNDPGLYSAIAELLTYGIDKDAIYKQACDTVTLDSMMLNAYAISQRMKVFPEHRMAMIALDGDDLLRYNYVKGDTEGLVNRPLAVPDITWSVFLRQDSEEMVKVSMRSKGDFPVNLVCEKHFGGGGHKNAAGGEFYGPIDEAISRLESVMGEFDCYIKG